jgi:hypothetical protein
MRPERSKGTQGNTKEGLWHSACTRPQARQGRGQASASRAFGPAAGALLRRAAAAAPDAPPPPRGERFGRPRADARAGPAEGEGIDGCHADRAADPVPDGRGDEVANNDLIAREAGRRRRRPAIGGVLVAERGGHGQQELIGDAVLEAQHGERSDRQPEISEGAQGQIGGGNGMKGGCWVAGGSLVTVGSALQGEK